MKLVEITLFLSVCVNMWFLLHKKHEGCFQLGACLPWTRIDELYIPTSGFLQAPCEHPDLETHTMLICVETDDIFFKMTSVQVKNKLEGLVDDMEISF
jgi:hypothetical protein